MTMVRRQIFGILIATIAFHFGLIGPANAVTAKEYADLCAQAEMSCGAHDERCASWRQAFNVQRSVCPGVNAPNTADMSGPPSASSTTRDASSGEHQKETLADLPKMCGAQWGRGFIAQTECLKKVIANSDSPDLQPSNPYVALYMLEADKLLDEVRQKRISDLDASIELQKKLLDGMDRQSAANESAARLESLESDREREMAAAQIRELAAAQRAESRRVLDEQNQAQDAQNQAAALDRLRLQCKAAMGSRPGVNGIDFASITKCDADPYAHLRPENQPRPPTRINCSSSGTNSFNCTSQ